MVAATLLALAAAVLHATWNLFLKTAPPADRELTAWGMFASAGVMVLPIVVLLGGPGWVAAPWLALSALIHVGYLLALVSAYHHGDFSLAYPLARGGGAMVATLGGVLLLGDHLNLAAWASIVVVGVALGSLVDRGASGRTLRDALVTALAIGAYTVVDAHGSRVSVDGAAYGFAVSAASACAITIAFLAQGRGPAFAAAWPVNRARWAAAGACTAAAYAMVLVAVRHAPVGYVAILRESSVVLGALLGWLWLKEELGGRRLVSSLVILAGMLGLIAATL